VPIVDNQTFDPPNKRFTVTLSNPQPSGAPFAATIKPPTKAIVTILDNDGPGTIDLSSPTYSVVEGAGVATITVVRDSAPNISESVDYATSDATATAGSDYTTTTGTITFASGEMSKSFQVPITDDSSYENDETVTVTLSNPQNLSNPVLGNPTLGPNTPGTLTIQDDDVPTFSFSAPTYSVDEADTTFNVTVNRGGDTSVAASIGYSDDGTGTATAGTDYDLTAGTLNFAPGETSKTFPVTIHNDSLAEGNETIGLQLTQGSSQVATALLSIVDNEDISDPSVQFSNVSYSVGEDATSVDVTVTLSEPARGGESIDYATADGGSASTATGVASLPAATDGTADYQTTNGTLTFAAGDTSKTITIPLNPDSVIEDDETFTVTLLHANHLQGGDPSQATVTILDDDSAGTLAFSAQRYDVNETDRQATITVRRSGGFGGSASVDYATSDGTAHAPDDYASTSGTLTFADGEKTKTFQIPVAWDGRQEGDETVSIQLSNFVSDDDPTISKAAVLHIADNGASGPVQFSAPSYDVLENAGQATITVSRSGGSLGGPVTVDYATSDGTAHAGTDYAATSGRLTFAAGEASRTFTVPVNDDHIRQGGRALNLTLSNPGGGTSLGSQSTATLAIGDDERVSSASTDRSKPKLKVKIKKVQRLAGGKLVLKVAASEATKLRVQVNLRKGAKLVKIAAASKRVAKGKTVTITIRLSKTALRKLRAGLVNGKEKVTFTVVGIDLAGNRTTVRRTITVK
jgi:Calx-beta domain